MSDTEPKSPPSHLLTAKGLGQMLSLSKRQIFRLNSCGKIPKPVRIGGAVRWSADEVSAWLAAGAPNRKLWETTRGKTTEHVQ
jgi:prophage regulatory protein